MSDEESNSDVTPLLSFAPNTNFWVLRAEGGKFYDDFIDDNYIGIRYNKVTIADLEELKESDEILSEDSVKELYKKKYDPESKKEMNRSAKQRLTQHAKQTYLFTFNMKNGDVVFVPSKRSEYFAVGFIDGEPYDESADYIEKRKKQAPANGLHFAISDYTKRRKICWVSTIRREELPSFLSWTVNAHQAIMDVKFDNEGQKTRLMGIIFPLFEYNGKINLRIHTAKGDSLSMADWETIISASNEKEKITLKANINSPGYFTFIVANTDWSSLINLLNQIWDFVKPIGGTFITLKTIFWFICGTDTKKTGVIKWFQDVYSKHLDNKMKKQDLKLKENSVAKKLNLDIRQSGNAIQNEHKTNLSSSDDEDHSEEKQKREEK